MKIITEWGSDYRRMWARQQQLQRAIIAGEHEPCVIITEHKPVYTLGKHGHEENMLRLPAGVECIRIDRGGDITYHGPGQLTVYPLVNLHELHLGVKDYVNALEQTVIDTIAEYGIKGERIEGATGVWLGAGTPAERKICAIGVKVNRGVTMHGFALNVNNGPEPFAAINPCGFIDKGVTSIAIEQGSPASMTEVAERLAFHLARQLTPKH